MGRMIDADKLKAYLQDKYVMYDHTLADIDAQPTVDAVEVVRCKDCRCWEKDGKICCGQTTVGEDESSIITGENDFCSAGVRWSDAKIH